MVNDIEIQLQLIHTRIKKACLETNRNENEVKLLLATKTVSTDRIKAALSLNESLIGENKVQELVSKYDALSEVPHQTHFIGHLQTNKINTVIQYADCIQTVDRYKLADKLNNRLELLDRSIDVFVQVNTSNESSKFGISPDEAVKFATYVNGLGRLNLKGLMTIGLFSADKQKVSRCYSLLKQLQQQMLDLDIPVQELSMGMSNDLELAIEAGATIVRVGTAIFGKRKYPDSYYWNER